MKLLYSGSVKNVYDDSDSIIFEYTDQYSIFDWGSMPDTIKNKGESLNFMGGMLFEMLADASWWQGWDAPAGFAESKLYQHFCQAGVDHHFLEFVEINGASSRFMRVKKINIFEPKPILQGGQMHLDYGAYERSPVNALVPLEVIFRFGMTQGSSLLKRVGDPEYLKELGIDGSFEVGDKLETPVIEFSTKLEKSDRYVTYKEARQIAGLTNDEFEQLKEHAQLIALRLRDLFGEHAIDLIDGKFEFAFIQKENVRSFMLVDSIGPDELRLIYRDQQLSKERLRGFYRGGAWHIAVEKAKAEAASRGIVDWKEICQQAPPKCEGALLASISGIYVTLTNTLAQSFGVKKPFEKSLSLEEVWESL